MITSYHALCSKTKQLHGWSHTGTHGMQWSRLVLATQSFLPPVKQEKTASISKRQFRYIQALTDVAMNMLNTSHLHKKHSQLHWEGIQEVGGGLCPAYPHHELHCYSECTMNIQPITHTHTLTGRYFFFTARFRSSCMLSRSHRKNS